MASKNKKNAGLLAAISGAVLWLSLPSAFMSASQILGISPKTLFIITVIGIILYAG